MNEINLIGKNWRSESDFYQALANALGSFAGHGHNADAFEETMIYNLELNTAQPPYKIVICDAPDELKPFLKDFASWISEARDDRKNDPEWGDDVEVKVSVMSPLHPESGHWKSSVHPFISREVFCRPTLFIIYF